MPTIDNSPEWMNSPWVEAMEDFEAEDKPIDLSKIAWFDVKLNLGTTQTEKKEHQKAIEEQIRLGVLGKNGVPPGVKMPPPKRPQPQKPVLTPSTNASPFMKRVAEQVATGNRKQLGMPVQRRVAPQLPPPEPKRKFVIKRKKK